jgi:hypothetical protein
MIRPTKNVATMGSASLRIHGWCHRRTIAGTYRSHARTHADLLCDSSQRTTIGSATTSRTLARGLSDDIASWKIICNRPRTSRSSDVLIVDMSTPSSSTLPDVGGGTRMIALPVVDLPHPDSPTIPRVSRFVRSRLTSLTAWTVPRMLGNSTTMCSTLSTTSSAPSRR